MANIYLQQDNGIFVWRLLKTSLFTVNSMYEYPISNGLKVSQIVWRLKILLKMEIFLWFFKRVVVLTKDSLAKRNWNEDKSCCFCSKPETIRHLLFQCSHAMFLCRSVHMVLGVKSPRNAQNLFNDWFSWKDKPFWILFLLMGAAAILWSIWITRNEVVFDKCWPKSLLYVLFEGIH
jgi:hypothetical protein